LQAIFKKEFSQVFLLAFLLNLIYYSHLLFAGINNLGAYDADYHLYLLEAVRKSLFEYHQLPYWDPWHMGGLPLLGNSQIPLSPLYVPILFFGTVAGAKITLVLLSVIGFTSAFYLGKFIGLTREPALAVAIVWSFSGIFASNIEEGWFLFSHLHLIPLAFLLFLKWKDDIRFAVLLGLLFSLIVFGGSPYPFVIGLLLFGIFALYYLIVDRNYKPLLFLFISGIVTILTSAIKLLPTLSWLSQNPRELEGILDGYSLEALFLSLTKSGLNIDYPTQKLFSHSYMDGAVLYASTEYAMYVGILVLVLAIAGLFYKNPYKLPLAISLLLILLIMLGDYSALPLWSLLKKFPVYGSMRVVARFKFDFIFLLSIFVGFGVSFISARIVKGNLFAKVILLLLFANLFAGNYLLLSHSFYVKQEVVKPQVKYDGSYFQIMKSPYYNRYGWLPDTHKYKISGMYPYIKANIGVTDGYEPFSLLVFARGVGSPEYHGEAFLSSGSNLYPAKFDSWSPNRFDISWEKGRAGLLYINQNYNKGWTLCQDSVKEVLNKGLIAIPVTKEDRHASLCYRPAERIGLWLSLLSLFAFVGYSGHLLKSELLCREKE